MKNAGRPGKPPWAGQDASTIGAPRSKSNTELLDEIDQMLSGPEDEVDVDAVEAHLAALQERVPVMEGYDPHAGWNQLQENHPALFEAKDEPKEVPRRRIRGNIHFARIAVVFAAVLLCSLVTVNALGINPVQSFLKWIGDTIQMCSNPSGMMELPPDVPGEYRSLREALDANGAEKLSSPTWIPRDYALQEVTVRSTNEMVQFTAWYASERGKLAIRILSINDSEWSAISEGELNGEKYIHNDVVYYLTSNFEMSKAGWIDDVYSCEVSGNIAEKELKQILDSMK